MSDHPTAASVKVSIGKGVEFDKPNEMRLADLYNIIRSPGSEDSKTAFKELREFVDQHIDRLTAIEEVPENERTEVLKTERKWIKENLNAQKNKLWGFTWSGRFSTRNNTGLIEHSGRLQGDLDLKDKPRIYSEQLRDRLGKDPHVEVAFLSPTARGVKIGILIPICKDYQEHKRAYLAAERYFRETYDVKLGPSRKDISGLCFFSHDLQLITNPNTVPLDIEKWPPDKKKSRSLSMQQFIAKLQLNHRQ